MIRPRTSPVLLTAALAVCGAAGAVLTDPVPASAQEEAAERVSLASLLVTAEADNPRILAAQKAAEAARARVPQAGALPDPTLGVGVMNLPVSEASLGREMMTMTVLELGERFPWPGKLALSEEAASLRADAANWEAERTRQEVRSEVKALYYRIYYLDRALAVTGRNETLLADLARLTSAKYAVGAVAQAEVLRAQVERTRLADQIVSLLEQRSSAAARLNALLARPPDTTVPAPELPGEILAAALEGERAVAGFASVSVDATAASEDAEVAPGIPGTEELRSLALEHNPMIRAHTRRVAAEERALALAEKAKLPDLTVSVSYGRRSRFSDLASLRVSMPLPVFSGRKQDQARVEQAAVLADHRARHGTMVDQVTAEIAALAAGLRRARDQLVLLEDGILPQARTGLSSSTASFQVGSVDFLTVLDAQVTLYRLELDYHRLLADFAADLAALERAVGTEVIR